VGGTEGGAGDTAGGITGVTGDTAPVSGTIDTIGASGTTGVDAEIATAASAAPSIGTVIGSAASAFGTATAANRTEPMITVWRRELDVPRIKKVIYPKLMTSMQEIPSEIFRKSIRTSTIELWQRFHLPGPTRRGDC
jgi:hypothetical protein